MSGRCKACNAILKETEIKWDPIRKEHEDLCLKCRQSVYNISAEDLASLDKLEEEVI